MLHCILRESYKCFPDFKCLLRIALRTSNSRGDQFFDTTLSNQIFDDFHVTTGWFDPVQHQLLLVDTSHIFPYSRTCAMVARYVIDGVINPLYFELNFHVGATFIPIDYLSVSISIVRLFYIHISPVVRMSDNKWYIHLTRVTE